MAVEKELVFKRKVIDFEIDLGTKFSIKGKSTEDQIFSDIGFSGQEAG